jgi:putative ABC transport system permease protein
MFRNYLKVTFRNIFRQKTYSILNLLGLSLGISCGLLLTLHIKEELSYEKSFSKYDRIYRVVSATWSKSSPVVAGEMMKYFPSINSIARFSDAGRNIVTSTPDTKTECKGYFADSTAPSMFDMKPVVGDAFQALSEPNSLVITRSMSEKLFGKEDPVGQKLIINSRDTQWVRAVIEDMPVNTHLQFDYLVSMSTFYKRVPPNWTGNRGWMFGWTYVLFNKKADIKPATERLSNFYAAFYKDFESPEDAAKDAADARFQPLTDIHLKSDLIQEMRPNSNIIYIYIFIAVEILILLIACVNFVNLFTTQALKRFREVGVRKVLGAQKYQLLLQFLGEAFVLTILAGIMAIGLYEIALPFYNNISGKHVSPYEILEPANLLIVTSIIVFTGLVSGFFPAVFVSGFNPVTSLKASKMPGSSTSVLRKGLVIFQFVVAGFLMISTVLVFQQVDLFHNKQLGFDKDQIAIINLYGDLRKKVLTEPELIKNEISSNPDILGVAKSSNIIGDDLSVENVTPVNPPAGKQFPSVRVYRIDENYLNVLHIRLKEGRNFSKEFNDSASFIINEKAAQMLELKNPLSSEIVNNTMGLRGKVVGIMEDFHFASLHNQIEPLVLEYRPQWTGKMLVKIKAGKTASVINFLKEKIEKIAPGTLFSYGFLDDKIAGLYKKEDNMSALLKMFSVLAIIISCLGLFGLVAHAAEIRTKEIGIRKVIGASILNLIRLMSKDFIILVII